MDYDWCKWFGTAWFCEGACPGGWKELKDGWRKNGQGNRMMKWRNKYGDGRTCWTGSKVYCCRQNYGIIDIQYVTKLNVHFATC